MRHHRHGLLLGKLTVDLINGGPGALSEGENGEASAPLYLVNEAHKCSDGKLVVIIRDPEHPSWSVRCLTPRPRRGILRLAGANGLDR